MLMPGRNFSSDGYRFGFNGKESDNETLIGGGPALDYGFRIYHPTLGRFLSIYPLSRAFPWLSPYQFAGNSPIIFLDLDGLETLDFRIWANKEGCGTGCVTVSVLKADDLLTVNYSHVDEKGNVTPLHSTDHYLTAKEKYVAEKAISGFKKDLKTFGNARSLNWVVPDENGGEVRNLIEEEKSNESTIPVNPPVHLPTIRGIIVKPGAEIKGSFLFDGKVWDKLINVNEAKKDFTLLLNALNKSDVKISIVGNVLLPSGGSLDDMVSGKLYTYKTLALERAQVLRDALVAKGIDSSRINTAVGTGPEQGKEQSLIYKFRK
jgi:RHS repeat-associated protein